jgi:hypothetical protein
MDKRSLSKGQFLNAVSSVSPAVMGSSRDGVRAEDRDISIVQTYEITENSSLDLSN